MRFIKRLFFTLVLLVLVLGGIAFILARTTPDWYRKYNLDPAQLEAAAQRVQDKLAAFQSWAGSQNQAERIAASGRPPVPTDPKEPPPEKITISLTEEELNAFFTKWGQAADAKAGNKMSEHVQDFVVNLDDGRIILAGKLNGSEQLMSIHLEPTLEPSPDGNGQRLRLEIARVATGVLPLPEALWSGYRNKLVTSLSQKVEQTRNEAAIVKDGSMNSAAVGAAMNKLLLSALEGGTVKPVLFLPHDPTHLENGYPVRLTEVRVEGSDDKTKPPTLTITVVPLAPAERPALLNYIREPYKPKVSLKLNPPTAAPPAANLKSQISNSQMSSIQE